MIEFIIRGTLASMKNNRVPSKHNPHITHVNVNCRIFRRDFYAQLPASARRAIGSLKKPLRATITIYYPSMRSDVDAEYLFDLLQEAGVIRNDRYVREKHIIGRIDRNNPRVEIAIFEADEQ